MAKPKNNQHAGMPAGAPPAVMRRIIIKGKEYPCRITMGAMLRFKRETGHDISSLNSGDMVELITFLHCCVTSACRADKIEFTMDVEEMADHLTPDDLNAFYDGVAHSEDAVEDGEKKMSNPT